MSTLALQSHVFSFSTSYLKWASLDLPSGSWLAVYIDSVPNGLHTRLRPYTSLSELERHLPFQLIQASSHERTIALCSRPHWTIPVPREETLALREKLRKVGWRRPNHKPSTTKIVAWAKSL